MDSDWNLRTIASNISNFFGTTDSTSDDVNPVSESNDNKIEINTTTGIENGIMSNSRKLVSIMKKEVPVVEHDAMAHQKSKNKKKCTIHNLLSYTIYCNFYLNLTAKRKFTKSPKSVSWGDIEEVGALLSLFFVVTSCV